MSRNWELGAPAWEARGVWYAGRGRYLPLIQTNADGSSQQIARIFDCYADINDGDSDIMLDDAHLLAAAPKLHAALEKCVALLERDYGGYDAIDEWKEAVAALAAAKGETAT